MKVAMPAGVWVLGFVSLFMDVASEMVHSVLPLFMVGVLGASAVTVGWIDGLARATAMAVKVFSGAISDWLGHRKWLAVAGYGLGALSKPLFAIAPSVDMVLSARLLDRFGKGIRGAPRDALVADVTPESIRGAAYGLRQSLDTIGAFSGPLLAVVLLWLWAGDFRLIFWLATIPAFFSVFLLIVFLKEPTKQVKERRRNPIQWASLRQLPPLFWQVVAFAALFHLARFSDAFLLLRAQEGGLTLAWIPLVLVVMNFAYSLTSYPAGVLSDKWGRPGILILGLIALLLANLALAAGNDWRWVTLGACLWGIHLGATQGVLAAMIAQSAPKELRATSFGIFNLACGLSLLVASVGAGLLWDSLGAAYAFIAGALVCLLSLLSFVSSKLFKVASAG